MGEDYTRRRLLRDGCLFSAGLAGTMTGRAAGSDAELAERSVVRKSAAVEVPLESRWRWFVEVNCSGDFNAAFPEFPEAAVNDNYGNGQPSLVYAGELEATPGAVSTYRIIGRSQQHAATTELGN